MILLELPSAATHPVVVYTAVATASLSIVLLAIAKVVGPVGDALESSAERRRQYKQREEDARVTDLSHQVDHLAGRVWTLERDSERQRDALLAHARWDQQILSMAIAAGLDVTLPPPLWPTIGDAP